MRPFIDKGLCSSCGLCVKVCLYDVFVVDDGEIIVLKPEACTECGSCVAECSAQAVDIQDGRKDSIILLE